MRKQACFGIVCYVKAQVKPHERPDDQRGQEYDGEGSCEKILEPMKTVFEYIFHRRHSVERKLHQKRRRRTVLKHASGKHYDGNSENDRKQIQEEMQRMSVTEKLCNVLLVYNFS